MLPDGQTNQNVYSGNTATSIDQVNRKIKRETDGFGRIVKVTEQDPAGILTQETNYSYNLLDKLTLVNQGNQTRSFSYDAMGRLLYERIPEQTATINDGTGTYWTTKYTYTDFGPPATRTDARGVVFTYNYDPLNRLTGMVVNTTNAPGVASGGGVSYTYDNNNGSPTNGLLLSAGYESYTYDSYKRLTSVTRSIGGVNYTISYQYGAGSLRSQIRYPSGRQINLNRDSIGRIASLTDQYSANYLSGVSYNAAGHVTGLTLGNAVVETYGYEPNRLQLSSQTATKNGGPQNGILNLTYTYQASAGEMGAATTAGNAGQLMSVSGTINSTTEAASYTYDNVGRLITSSQTSNGSSAQRRFSYDRWGNRLGTWDAVIGGNQIQSLVLQQFGGAPTNQVQSVITGGVAKNYSYDAAGNVTNDGVHTYQYDGANRIVNVDGGATAQYLYDHDNRRYKTVVGSATKIYLWEGSNVVCEYNGAGALLSENIFNGNRMIAKLVGGGIQYLLCDRLSERLTLDANGNVIGRQGHLPYGENFAESGTQENRHFTTYDRNAETGADYAVNRHYVSTIGRFNSADPYRLSGGIRNPQSWNRYNYSHNDPLNKVDPLGLICLVTVTDTSNGDGPANWVITDVMCLADPPAFWLSDSSQGTGTPYRNPCEKEVVSGNTALDEMRARAVNNAKTALAKGACADLFQGRDASKFLSDLFGAGFITFQKKYAKIEKNKAKCKNFSGDRNGAVTTPGLAAVPGPAGRVSAGLIQINASGYFVDMLDERGIRVNANDPNTGKPNYEPFFELSDDDVRAATLLHELLHSMGILGPDQGDTSGVNQTNRDIVSKCIK